MAKKAAKKVAKKVATKPEKPEEKDPNLAAPHADVNEEAELSKDKKTIEPTGKFEVVQVGKDEFRMFNHLGAAVSPVVTRGDKTEHGKDALSKLQRDAARSNALRKGRETRTPAGHQAA